MHIDNNVLFFSLVIIIILLNTKSDNNLINIIILLIVIFVIYYDHKESFDNDIIYDTKTKDKKVLLSDLANVPTIDKKDRIYQIDNTIDIPYKYNPYVYDIDSTIFDKKIQTTKKFKKQNVHNADMTRNRYNLIKDYVKPGLEAVDKAEWWNNLYEDVYKIY